MTIVGFNFTKMDIEKKNPIEGKLEIKNNVKVTDIVETEMHVGKQKQKIAKFIFNYESLYNPSIGHIKIDGDLLYMNDEKTIAKIIKAWASKKQKDIPEEIMAPVLNTILNKSSIMALQLSKEVNLPPQVQLPKVKIQN